MLRNKGFDNKAFVLDSLVGGSEAIPSKILILCTTNFISGTDRVVQNLAHGLSLRGVVTETIIPWDKSKEKAIAETIEWHRQAGVAVTAAPEFARQNQGWYNVKTLANFIRLRRDIEIVNIHYSQNTSVSLTDILAIRLAGKKPVIMVHHPTHWNELRTKQYQTIKMAFKLAAAVVGTTECMSAFLKQSGVPARKMVTIPLGIIPPKKVVSQSEVREKLGIPSDAFVICTLSRLMADKGIFELIDAFLGLSAHPLPAYLVVAGDGPERAAMEKKAGSLLGNSIRFLGRVDEVSDVYASGDVFALPSYWEGFGLVYVEAGFYGLPSIGSNVGGTPYVIEDGVTGLLVPPHDIASIAAALERLRDQKILRMKMGSAARDRAYADFTEEQMTQRFQQLFQQVASRSTQ